MKRLRWAFGLGLIAVVCGWSTLSYSEVSYVKNHKKHVSGEILVKSSDLKMDLKTTLESVFQNEKSLKNLKVLSVEPLKTDASLSVVRLSNDQAVDEAISKMKSVSGVVYAERNILFHIQTIGEPNDPRFGEQWSLLNQGQVDSSGQEGVAGADLRVTQVWAEGNTGSRDVLVAVIDTGVSWTHPDLVSNLYTNPGEIADNGIDDDGNGFVDDIHGWNFVSKNKNSDDDHDHGTHVSGTIGAATHNEKGIAGVTWKVSILPVKFLNANGSGTLAAAVESINYARMMGAEIMNNSWGGGGFTQSLFDAIKATEEAGVLFLAAAGNDRNDNDANPSYPATYDVANIVSVAATDNRDELASFSNWGATKVHVAAPGVRILSTVKDGTYKAFSGTSMATPHVAGAAALLKSIFPSWTYSDLKDNLIRTSDPVRALKRKVVAKGRVNVHNAVHGIVPPTNEPDESLWRSRNEQHESAHPYAANEDRTIEISVPGSRYLRLHFEKIDTERNYDKIEIRDGNGQLVETLSGAFDNYTSEYVQSDRLTLKFTSDSSVQNWGFRVDQVHYIP